MQDNRDMEVACDGKNSTNNFVAVLATLVGGALRLVTNSLAFILVAGVIGIFWIEWNNEEIVFEPYEISPELQTKTWSGRIFAHAVIDEIHSISRQSNTAMKHTEIIGSWNEKPSQFKIPGSEVSIDSLVSYLKRYIGQSESRVTGEIVKARNKIFIITRVNNQSPLIVEFSPSKTQTSFKRVAEYIYQYTQPYILASYYFDRDKNKCQRTIDIILSSQFEDPKVDKANKAWAHNLLGLMFQLSSRHEEAASEYRKAIAIDPSFTLPYTNWGESFAEQGDYENATEKFKAALEIDNENSTALVDWGNVLSEKGDLEGAMAKYQEAIAHDPKFSAALVNLGNCLVRRGEYSSAITMYEKALATDSTFEPALNNKGVVFHLQGDYKKALAEYVKAVEVNQGFAEGHYNSGLALMAQGRKAEAYKKIKKAQSLHNGLHSDDALLVMAW